MKCEFPHCDFTAYGRHQIHKHHINPLERGGSDAMWNIIWLCPTHHNLVYSEHAGHGVHTKDLMNMIRIIGWAETSWGRALQYESMRSPGTVLMYPAPEPRSKFMA